MTTGQLVFFSGVGLLIVTLILGIIFVVKKPTYKPENPTDSTAKTLYKSYPSDDFTVALGYPDYTQESCTIILSDETELLPDESIAP